MNPALDGSLPTTLFVHLNQPVPSARVEFSLKKMTRSKGKARPIGNGSVTSAAPGSISINGSAPESISINGNAPESLKKRDPPRPNNRSSRKYKHTSVVHLENCSSCLSHDAATAPSFLGFRNLMGLVLVMSNLRLMMENSKKYGILVTLSGINISADDWRWFATLYVMTPGFLFLAWGIESLAAQFAKDVVARQKRLEDSDEGGDEIELEVAKKTLFSRWANIAIAHGANATVMLVFTTYVVYYLIHNPALGAFTELHAVIVWLKVCSYAFTNRDLRLALLNRDPEDAALPDLYKTCPYPQNVTVSNLAYFWLAPTLVYQPVYPRTAKINWSYVGKRAAECVLLCIVIWILCAQYAVPVMQNSLAAISDLNAISILERTLKLSTISLLCWLAGFFALFQSFLNGLAEVMRFGSRDFYDDWWNSASVRGYWTTWNKPVTHFMKRHIYAPMVGRGVPRTLAQILTFLLSGVLHELLVGVPTHNILGVAFFGMALQLPLIFLTDPLARHKSQNAQLLGNLVFWIFFCILGQPFAALIYFFAWQTKYGGDTRPKWPTAVVWSAVYGGQN